MDKLERRMYFFTLYNISEIQKGIQCGHAALEYANNFHDCPDYKSFIKNDKTWIILNGGTTNSCDECLGSLNEILQSIEDNNIKHASFYEPDLNDALTAICFIADERVYNFKDYPDLYEDVNILIEITTPEQQAEIKNKYDNWVKEMGGEQNVFLRNLIKNRKLA